MIKRSPMKKAVNAGLSLITFTPMENVYSQCSTPQPKMQKDTEHIFMLGKKEGNKFFPKAGIQVRVYHRHKMTKSGLGFDDEGNKIAEVVETKALWSTDGMGPAVHDCMLYYFAYFFGNDFWSIADRGSVSDLAAVLREYYFKNRSFEIESLRLDNENRPVTPTRSDDTITHTPQGGYTTEHDWTKMPSTYAFRDIAVRYSEDGFIDASADYETLYNKGCAMFQSHPGLNDLKNMNQLLQMDDDLFNQWFSYWMEYEEYTKGNLPKPDKPNMTGIYFNLRTYRIVW